MVKDFDHRTWGNQVSVYCPGEIPPQWLPFIALEGTRQVLWRRVLQSYPTVNLENYNHDQPDSTDQVVNSGNYAGNQ